MLGLGGAVTVRIRERLYVENPPDALAIGLRSRCTYRNPERHAAEQRGQWTRAPKHVRNYTEDDQGTIVLGRGCTKKVRQEAEDNHVRVTWVDERQRAPVEMPSLEEAEAALAQNHPPIVLIDRQHEAAGLLVEKQNAYFRGMTGLGKSLITIIAAIMAGERTLILVPTAGLVDQMLEACGKALAPDLYGKLISKPCDLGAVMVCTYKMLVSIKERGGAWADEVRASFGTVIADELQNAAAPTVRDAIEWMPARNRWGASSSEQRADRMEFLIYDAFGQMADHVTLDEALELGRIIQTTVRVVPTGFSDPEFEEVALRANLPPRLRTELYAQVRKAIEKDQARTALIADRVAVAHAQGHSCLVLAEHIAHCQAILDALAARGVESAFLRGGPENKRAFREGVAALNHGEVRCAVGTSAVFYGLDVARLDRGFVAVPTANLKLFDQMLGRFRRKFEGKDTAEVSYFWDSRIYPGHAKKIAAKYKRFEGLVTIEDEEGG